jgi:hypothetical protein
MNPHCRIGRVRPKDGGDVRLLPSANIQCLPNLVTRHDIPAERVLLGAVTKGISPVVVCGKAPDGTLYLANSAGSNEEMFSLLLRATHMAVNYVDGDAPVSREPVA